MRLTFPLQLPLKIVILIPALIALIIALGAPSGRADDADDLRGGEAVEFNRDIRPILSDNCFACHGPDEGQRQADYRLDVEDIAKDDRGGYFAIKSGSLEESSLYERITADDPLMRMPPPEFGKTLSPRQIDLLRRWILQGAKWQKHWSQIPPRRPAPPEITAEIRAEISTKGNTETDNATAKKRRVINPIDQFILARLAREGLEPSPPADRRTLIRRLSFDLIGFPPSPEEVEAFVKDTSPDAYEKFVDRLFASQHYGERMAMYWLDLVRFADTNGIHGDNHREHAPYRDYVIDAFNNNKPFDQFTIEQLAGDLLPKPTIETKIASGYNRLNMTTREGGAQAKEYRAKYAADRVRNASTVWLGSTLGCAECHDHKFDPFTTKDFYRFASFFADIQETAVGAQQPVKLPTPEQKKQHEEVTARLAELKQRFDEESQKLGEAQAAWEIQMREKLASADLVWQVMKPLEVKSSGGATLVVQDDFSVLSTGENPAKDNYTATFKIEKDRITGVRLEALTHDSFTNKSLSRANGNFVLTEFEAELDGQPVKISKAIADFSQDSFPVAHAVDGKANTGWAVDGHSRAENRKAVFVFEKPIENAVGKTLAIRLKHESRFAQHNIGRFRISTTGVEKPSLEDQGLAPGEVAAALAAAPEKRSAEQNETIAKHFRSVAEELAPLREKIAAVVKEKKGLEDSFPPILISMSGPPREMRVLPRGNWLDDSGPVVQPGTPDFLPPLNVSERRASRLDLAKWLISPQNPLTARVFVNRIWKLCFGHGIVRTMDDFGSQGAWPTHLELLDWLATEFIDSGWNIKHVHKLMVMSSTYRQSSLVSPEVRKRDPYNKLFARQSRFRLDAEMVRDNALEVSGLLVKTVGGRSVKPYQPVGYWAHLNFPTRTYQADSGENQYRRGLYTYWCRTFLHPSMLAFDAPSREECVVERPRSNTPLQALVLLNDPTYVEAARALAERILREGGDDVVSRIEFVYQQTLQRSPRSRETDVLAELLQQHLEEYRTDKKAADELLQVGQRPAPKDLDGAELAAWTSIARVMLNLHETVTRN